MTVFSPAVRHSAVVLRDAPGTAAARRGFPPSPVGLAEAAGAVSPANAVGTVPRCR